MVQLDIGCFEMALTNPFDPSPLLQSHRFATRRKIHATVKSRHNFVPSSYCAIYISRAKLVPFFHSRGMQMF